MANNKSFKNRSGFSLLEVMVVIAISGITSVIMAQMLSNLGHSVVNLEARTDKVNLQREIMNLVGSRKSCSDTFKNVVIPVSMSNYVSPNIPEIRLISEDAAGNTIFAIRANTSYSPKIAISNINLRNFLPTGIANVFKGDLYVSQKPGTGGQAASPVIIKGMFFEIDGATRRVTSCNSALENTVSQCTYEGTWFYYDDGGGNDFGISCRNGRITGWCGNSDPVNGNSPRGLVAGYICEGNSTVKVYQ